MRSWLSPDRLHCRLYAASVARVPRIACKAAAELRRIHGHRWGPARTLPERKPRLLQHALCAGERQVPAQPDGPRQQPGRPDSRLRPGPSARARPLRQRFVDHALGLSVLHPEPRRHAGARAGRRRIPGQRPSFPTRSMCAKAAASSAGYCLTEADVNPFVRGDGFRAPPHADAIAIGDWAIESTRLRRRGARRATAIRDGYMIQPRRPGAIPDPRSAACCRRAWTTCWTAVRSARHTSRSAPRGSRPCASSWASRQASRPRWPC